MFVNSSSQDAYICFLALLGGGGGGEVVKGVLDCFEESFAETILKINEFLILLRNF